MNKDGYWIRALTPPDTEEIKPGLFIQKKLGRYRQVHPAAWDGKIIKNNLFFGGDFLKSFIFFAILMLIVWGYQHDVREYQEFYENIRSNPMVFCNDVDKAMQITCSEQNELLGLCNNLLDGSNQFKLGKILSADK